MGSIAQAGLDVTFEDLTALFGAAITLKDHFHELSDAQSWVLVEIMYRRSAELKAHFEQRLWPAL